MAPFPSDRSSACSVSEANLKPELGVTDHLSVTQAVISSPGA